ncbi:beta-N-acetylhexosaminidase [Tessaracoccus antarcticus]|uniref:beta-N-acetylhexosaminidase n=1 Tax=Tessaracoccus antarcticus TaxID=2479848 RepID=A0A3M0GRI5_9ACTN|nr:beta-N-acetylhexosaminidase [Tessaracoccus antarcticus]RMB59886.1 beta-hexosaminidase [Tessaracoccus antarcticus]
MNLVPTPLRVDMHDGNLLLGPAVLVHGGGNAALVLAERLTTAAGLRVEAVTLASEATVSFSIDEALGAEAYRLEVDDTIRIVSGDEQGAGWAVQSLLQLLPAEIHGPGPMDPATLQVPRVLIEDAPRFGWRGSMLDVARHFMPMEHVLRHLDAMAMHKLNVLHLHLTDDQGWRLPVAAYPLLTEVGGWRPGTLPGHQPPPDENDCDDFPQHDGRPHGGSYTVEEIGALVARAARLGITVVPEMDMPGHMEAAIAAYPWLGACDHVSHPRTCFGVSEHILQLSDRSVEFCTTVLDAAMELFPGSPIHVGGDECPSREWLTDPASQATMATIGAADGHAAQAWFEQKICQHVLDAGRRVIAWDEVLDGGAPEGTTVMVWREAEAIARAAAMGFDVIAAPVEFTYLDYAQSDAPDHPLSIDGPRTLEKVAGLHTVFDALDPAIAHRVLGGQFQLWSEYLRTPQRVEFFAWPRGSSVASQLWNGTSEGASSIDDLAGHLPRLTAAGINWCRPAN